MTRYILRRSLQSLFLLWLSTLLSFAIYQAAPGGPLLFLERSLSNGAAGGGKSAVTTEATMHQLTRLHGLDRSLPVQYVAWLAGEDWLPATVDWRSGRCLFDNEDCSRGLLRLDFGRSFFFKGERVADVIVERIPATALLGFSSFLVVLLIGLPLGILSALWRGTWFDTGMRIFTVLASTMPDWWLGLLLLIILGGYLDLVPLGGMGEIGDNSWQDRLHHLLLPAIVAATGGWIGVSRIVRFSILDVLGQDFVRTARAKGLTGRTLMMRHVLRNALLPFVTGLSGVFLLIIDGTVLFELVFAWPGMGRLAIIALQNRDYPVMMALLTIGSFLGILGVLLVDILYGIVDPRIKYTPQGIK